MSLRTLSDLADTLLAQRLSEIGGVGNVATQGGIKPAVRIQADLPRLAAYGLGLEDIRQAIVNANVSGPKGAFDGAYQSYTIAANDQLAAARSLSHAGHHLPQQRARDAARRRRGGRRAGEHQGRAATTTASPP